MKPHRGGCYAGEGIGDGRRHVGVYLTTICVTAAGPRILADGTVWERPAERWAVLENGTGQWACKQASLEPAEETEA